jgi:hypothetical protein
MTTKYDYQPGKELPTGLTRWVFNIVRNCKGKDKAITRDEINTLLINYHDVEVSTRSLRKITEEIRRMGIRLCDLENGSGLFVAKTQEEYDVFKMRYAAHAWSLIKTVRAMDDGISVDELDDDSPAAVKPVQMRMI